MLSPFTNNTEKRRPHGCSSFMNPDIIFSQLYGSLVSAVVELGGNSIRLGFGAVEYRNFKSNKPCYTWECGCYYSAWRLESNDGRIELGSVDLLTGDNVSADFLINESLVLIEGDGHDVKMIFRSGMLLRIMSASADNDESFHVFSPNGKYVKYLNKKWVIIDR